MQREWLFGTQQTALGQMHLGTGRKMQEENLVWSVRGDIGTMLNRGPKGCVGTKVCLFEKYGVRTWLTFRRGGDRAAIERMWLFDSFPPLCYVLFAVV